MQSALDDCVLDHQLDCVTNEDDLFAYLERRGRFSHLTNIPLPGLIILELNVQDKAGHDILVKIKSDARFELIPIVMMSVSDNVSEIETSYKLGANSYVKKPDDFDSLVDTVRNLCHYWFKTVTSLTQSR